MDSTVFQKMRLKAGVEGYAMNPPNSYTQMIKTQDFVQFKQMEKYGFVHLFVKSQQELKDQIMNALSFLNKDGVLWISYPKNSKGTSYDINRDSLNTLAQSYGITGV